LVTELLGSDLSQVFERLESLELGQRWGVVSLLGRMLLRRLEAVHACGYVHGDVATHNVLMGPARSGSDELVPYLIDFGCAQKYLVDVPEEPKEGSLEFCSVRSTSSHERRPEDDLEALGWVMVTGVVGDLPWFAWLDEFYNLKPALQRIKRPKIIERVQQAKASLVAQGWDSLGPEWQSLAGLPDELKRYMRKCQVPRADAGSGRPDWRKLAALLGAVAGMGLAEAEREDMRQLQAIVAAWL